MKKKDMMVRIVFGLILCALICGCANSAPRFTLDDGEGVYTYTNETSKDQKTSYYLAEEWLSINIANANKVITLRQPETGTLIANPQMQIPMALTMLWCSYSLKIVCLDNQVITKFTVGKLESGAYPPKNSMPEIQEICQQLSSDLQKYINNN
ncbi:MAG: hypothetical protein QM218_06690 [Candidatus Cloacimonadota bacterium]|nr:hypothetical protein [Candidatus Cloacimonadota bacterium]